MISLVTDTNGGLYQLQGKSTETQWKIKYSLDITYLKVRPNFPDCSFRFSITKCCLKTLPRSVALCVAGETQPLGTTFGAPNGTILGIQKVPFWSPKSDHFGGPKWDRFGSPNQTTFEDSNGTIFGDPIMPVLGALNGTL